MMHKIMQIVQLFFIDLFSVTIVVCVNAQHNSIFAHNRDVKSLFLHVELNPFVSFLNRFSYFMKR